MNRHENASRDDDAITAAEAAMVLGVSLQSVRVNTRKGVIPSYSIGRLRRYSRAQLEAFRASGGDRRAQRAKQAA